ncbi:baseplate multidomain protein megatron [Brevundimonas lutea]|uniref:baseplate multidomain protein megatron n=1 Tax=Brevundimonas lutea TaxID=2293980 RepID=UPI000F015EAA|nr:glycoside hydrolase/phage tail family protein [Brevundimonas lutea]
MAQVILGGVGGAIGGGIGRALGALAGRALDGLLVSSLAAPRQRGPRLETLRLQATAEGQPMACALGRVRVTGQMIWAARFLERRNENGGGKGGPRTVDYDYSLSFAVALCEGPIDGIGRVWADGQPLRLDGATMRVHRGTEVQQPDPLIEAVEGAAPAYRGTAYVVFEDLPLAPFGNRPPQLSFEVLRRVSAPDGLEEMLEGVCLIPGAGEFTLATQPVFRREGLTRTTAENLNNLIGSPDLRVAVDQLERDFPRVKRVNLVVGWFGTDLRAGECRIWPGVERRDKPTEPIEWGVAGLGRDDAHLISGHEGRPAYGGTPSDQTVVDAVRMLKDRGYEVVIYPFVFMDIAPENGLDDPYGGLEQAPYPWRGRITGSDRTASVAGEVAAFFGGPDDWGLRRMARHYAELTVEAGADGMLVGSELRGVTTLRDEAGGYPAVTELVALAGECRAILGAWRSLSYAADWSEYFGHQPADGSGHVAFHLDPLWSNAAVDHVAIDWYAPITDWRGGEAHLDALEGWDGVHGPDYLDSRIEGGEGFDWFYANPMDRDAQTRTPITDGAHDEPWVYRCKDLRNWWGRAHHDRPDGVRAETPTAWTAGMKPIRLVEFGCAAVDKGANAPNLFVDPKSSESHLPPYSTGDRDDLMQRRALEAMLRHWRDPANNPEATEYAGRMIEGLDAWCWDARPYPDFPARVDVWADGPNWTGGHWLNGRAMGDGSDLIRAVLERGGLEEAEFSIRGVEGAAAGYLIDRPMRTRDALEPLLLAFGAEAAEQGGRVAVIGRPDSVVEVSSSSLALPEEGPAIRTTRTLEATPDQVRVRFIDETADYQTGAVSARRADTGGGGADVDLPLAATTGFARRAARRLLEGASAEVITLALDPITALWLEPGDGVRVAGREGLWRVGRVTRDEQPSAEARLYLPGPPVEVDPDWRPGDPPGTSGRPFVAILDLPPLPGAEGDDRPLAAVAVEPWRPMRVHAGGGVEGLTPRGDVTQPATVGVLKAPLGAGPLHRWDEVNGLVVRLEGQAPESRSARSILAGAGAVAVEAGSGWEIVQYRRADLIEPGLWRLSGLLRGQQGTDGEMRVVSAIGARVVVLDDALVRLEVSGGERGLPLIWRAGPAGAPPGGDGFEEVEATWRGVQARPWSPAHLAARSDGEGGYRLSWTARTRLDGDRWDGETLQADLPERWRVSVGAGEAAVRRWEVEATEAMWSAGEVEADFPDGIAEAWVEVAQGSAVFGWGASARIALT